MKKGFEIAKKIPLLLFMITLLTACEHTPKSTNTSPERPLQVIRASNGIHQVLWKIIYIDGQAARSFSAQPSLQFHQQSKRIQGNTGCNALSGDFEINTQLNELRIWAKAQHQSCAAALAQEADLMTALMNVKRYQMDGVVLRLLNEQGRTLLLLRP